MTTPATPDLAASVTTAVADHLVAALIGVGVAYGLGRAAGIDVPWWVGAAVGAAVGASVAWHRRANP